MKKLIIILCMLSMVFLAGCSNILDNFFYQSSKSVVNEQNDDEVIIDNSKTVADMKSYLFSDDASYAVVNTNELYKAEIADSSQSDIQQANLSIKETILTADDKIIAFGTTNHDIGMISRQNDATVKQNSVISNCSDVWIACFDLALNIEWIVYPIESISNEKALILTDLGSGNYRTLIAVDEIADASTYDKETVYNIPDNPKYISVRFNEEGVIASQKEVPEREDVFEGYVIDKPMFYISPYIDNNQIYFDTSYEYHIASSFYESSPMFRVLETRDGGFLFYGKKKFSDWEEFSITGFHFIDETSYEREYMKYYNNRYKNNQFSDVLVIKTDKNLKMEWHRYCGGKGEDYVAGAAQGDDGRFYFVGESASLDGDVKDWSKAKNISGNGRMSPIRDRWTFVLSEDGKLEFSKCNSDEYMLIERELVIESDIGTVWFEHTRNIFGDKYEDMSYRFLAYSTYELNTNFTKGIKRAYGLSVRDVTGSYEGFYTNNSGQMRLNLKITNMGVKNGMAKVDAVVMFEPASSNEGGKPGSYKAAGEFDLETGKILLKATEWISEKPEFYEMLDIGGIYNDGKIEGEFDRDEKTDFVLLKIE